MLALAGHGFIFGCYKWAYSGMVLIIVKYLNFFLKASGLTLWAVFSSFRPLGGGKVWQSTKRWI
jgi:hypothetical protein